MKHLKTFEGYWHRDVPEGKKPRSLGKQMKNYFTKGDKYEDEEKENEVDLDDKPKESEFQKRLKTAAKSYNGRKFKEFIDDEFDEPTNQ